MKSIIPFSKELKFDGKLSEITSISLEREFTVEDTSIEGNLLVTGDYKSHEVSANVIPFSFKIPFSIEIPEDMISESISLEIHDFAYDILETNAIKVNIELEFCGDLEEKEEVETVFEKPDTKNMMAEEDLMSILEDVEEVKDEENRDSSLVTSNQPNLFPEEAQQESVQIVNEEEVSEEKESDVLEVPEESASSLLEKPELKEEEEVVLNGITDENEYATYHIHIVKEGESVETICTMYHSNLNLLSEYNDLGNFTVGEKLIIPESDES